MRPDTSAGPRRWVRRRAECSRISCRTRRESRKIRMPAASSVVLNEKPENTATVPSWLK